MGRWSVEAFLRGRGLGLSLSEERSPPWRGWRAEGKGQRDVFLRARPFSAREESLARWSLLPGVRLSGKEGPCGSSGKSMDFIPSGPGPSGSGEPRGLAEAQQDGAGCRGDGGLQGQQ